ncbi:hypothetical protein C9374_011808 [Naegleria lovaniensis]|uniref:Uncharacterized protein n=1 Tax=Naegleria lovaniensis TaxID=51637 RepID=A0AA88GE04_NAELO|nr:uncharacterized protein C9374_011808 [Naegleria lovaniensis]KAG2373719.1 hypothetical protein C9374_011808 [Naegleria lovaniensis]
MNYFSQHQPLVVSSNPPTKQQQPNAIIHSLNVLNHPPNSSFYPISQHVSKKNIFHSSCNFTPQAQPPLQQENEQTTTTTTPIDDDVMPSSTGPTSVNGEAKRTTNNNENQHDVACWPIDLVADHSAASILSFPFVGTLSESGNLDNLRDVLVLAGENSSTTTTPPTGSDMDCDGTTSTTSMFTQEPSLQQQQPLMKKKQHSHDSVVVVVNPSRHHVIQNQMITTTVPCSSSSSSNNNNNNNNTLTSSVHHIPSAEIMKSLLSSMGSISQQQQSTLNALHRSYSQQQQVSQMHVLSSSTPPHHHHGQASPIPQHHLVLNHHQHLPQQFLYYSRPPQHSVINTIPTTISSSDQHYVHALLQVLSSNSEPNHGSIHATTTNSNAISPSLSHDAIHFTHMNQNPFHTCNLPIFGQSAATTALHSSDPHEEQSFVSLLSSGGGLDAFTTNSFSSSVSSHSHSSPSVSSPNFTPSNSRAAVTSSPQSVVNQGVDTAIPSTNQKGKASPSSPRIKAKRSSRKSSSSSTNTAAATTTHSSLLEQDATSKANLHAVRDMFPDPEQRNCVICKRSNMSFKKNYFVHASNIEIYKKTFPGLADSIEFGPVCSTDFNKVWRYSRGEYIPSSNGNSGRIVKNPLNENKPSNKKRKSKSGNSEQGTSAGGSNEGNSSNGSSRSNKRVKKTVSQAIRHSEIPSSSIIAEEHESSIQESHDTTLMHEVLSSCSNQLLDPFNIGLEYPILEMDCNITVISFKKKSDESFNLISLMQIANHLYQDSALCTSKSYLEMFKEDIAQRYADAARYCDNNSIPETIQTNDILSIGILSQNQTDPLMELDEQYLQNYVQSKARQLLQSGDCLTIILK